MGLLHLPKLVLQQIALHTVHHPRNAPAHGRTARWFHSHQLGVGVHKAREDASGIGPTAHTGNDVLRIGTVEDHPALLMGLLADDALEFAHHPRIRVRTHD